MRVATCLLVLSLTSASAHAAADLATMHAADRAVHGLLESARHVHGLMRLRALAAAEAKYQQRKTLVAALHSSGKASPPPYDPAALAKLLAQATAHLRLVVSAHGPEASRCAQALESGLAARGYRPSSIKKPDVEVQIAVRVQPTGTRTRPGSPLVLHLVEAEATVRITNGATGKDVGAFTEKYTYGSPSAQAAQHGAIEQLAARLQKSSAVTADLLIKARPLNERGQ